MRADRLLSLLMLLQARGRMTARQLAAELEVSERTIYRDVEALCIAGVPIYAETGREGGYALLDHYRTSLTGLNENEVRALFMLSIPSPLHDLGLSQELRRALLKLSAALPASRRGDEEQVRRRTYLDSTWSDWQEGSVPHLQRLYQAVWQDRRITLTYRPLPAVEIEQHVDPYGLVAKAGIWYLVSAHKAGLRVHRVSDLVAASLLEETFERPPAFDLVGFWEAWCREREQSRTIYAVTVRVAPDFLRYLPKYFGSRIQEKIARAGTPDADGWLTLELAFQSFEAARDRLLAFGRGVEVLAPAALRASILDYAIQIQHLYSKDT